MKLIKESSPGWTKEFADEGLLIDELRKHICDICLNGGEPDYVIAVDVERDGEFYECRNLLALLSTPCGCEFDVEKDDGSPWWKD